MTAHGAAPPGVVAGHVVLRRCLGPCGRELPLNDAHFPGRFDLSRMGVRYRDVCRECTRAAQKRRAAQRRLAKRYAKMTPFEQEMLVLERKYGPMATWSSAVHAEHTLRLQWRVIYDAFLAAFEQQHGARATWRPPTLFAFKEAWRLHRRTVALPAAPPVATPTRRPAPPGHSL